jgi:hypothetical protein
MDPHLLDVDASVLHHEESIRLYKLRESPQGTKRALVCMRRIVDHQARRARGHVAADSRGEGRIEEIAGEEQDAVPVPGISARQLFLSFRDVEVHGDDAWSSDIPIACESSQPVPEPQRAPAVLGAEFDHDLDPGPPEDVLIGPQVLRELEHRDSGVCVEEALTDAALEIVNGWSTEIDGHRGRQSRHR